ncbi:unnamed protein product, partial [Pleuronectes platessa]
MFIQNANPQQPRRHDFLLRGRTYRGELPSVAGFLLYPDTPAKMETTSQEGVLLQARPRPDRGKEAISHRDTAGVTLSSSPKPRDKQEEETAAGTGNAGGGRDSRGEHPPSRSRTTLASTRPS